MTGRGSLHEPKGSLGVALGLDQQVQHLTFAVDGSPQIHALALDRDHHFVQVPPAAGLGRSRRKLRANRGPNFSTQRRMLSYEVSMPRSAKSSSTSR